MIHWFNAFGIPRRDHSTGQFQLPSRFASPQWKKRFHDNVEWLWFLCFWNQLNSSLLGDDGDVKSSFSEDGDSSYRSQKGLRSLWFLNMQMVSAWTSISSCSFLKTKDSIKIRLSCGFYDFPCGRWSCTTDLFFFSGRLRRRGPVTGPERGAGPAAFCL